MKNSDNPIDKELLWSKLHMYVQSHFTQCSVTHWLRTNRCPTNESESAYCEKRQITINIGYESTRLNQRKPAANRKGQRTSYPHVMKWSDRKEAKHNRDFQNQTRLKQTKQRWHLSRILTVVEFMHVCLLDTAGLIINLCIYL